MSTGNQQSNNARQRYQYPYPYPHQSPTSNSAISTRNHRINHRPIHPNTTRPPPLQSMARTSPVNHNSQNKATKRKSKSNIWKYLEFRKGSYCYLISDITAHGIPIPKNTIAIVEQDDKDSMPYLSFSKPYSNYRWTNGIKKATLSFGMCVPNANRKLWGGLIFDPQRQTSHNQRKISIFREITKSVSKKVRDIV